MHSHSLFAAFVCSCLCCSCLVLFEGLCVTLVLFEGLCVVLVLSCLQCVHKVSRMAKDSKEFKRWSHQSKAAQFLTNGLSSGDVNPNPRPKNIYKNNPIFHEYGDESLRSAWNGVKQAMGCYVKRGIARWIGL